MCGELCTLCNDVFPMFTHLYKHTHHSHPHTTYTHITHTSHPHITSHTSHPHITLHTSHPHPHPPPPTHTHTRSSLPEIGKEIQVAAVNVSLSGNYECTVSHSAVATPISSEVNITVEGEGLEIHVHFFSLIYRILAIGSKNTKH